MRYINIICGLLFLGFGTYSIHLKMYEWAFLFFGSMILCCAEYVVDSIKDYIDNN